MEEANSVIASEDLSPEQAEPKLCHFCSGDNAQFQCGKCSQVHYCSKKCQVDDWKKSHKKNCYPLKVKLGEDGRRHVYATRAFQAGEIMWKEIPMVSGPVDMKVHQGKYEKRFTTLPEFCIGCCKEVWPKEGVECKGCGIMTCGSEICLNNDMHKGYECSILQDILKAQDEPTNGLEYMSRTEIAYLLRVLKLKDDTESWTKFLEFNDFPKPMSVEKYKDITIDGKLDPKAIDNLFDDGGISISEYRYNVRYREFVRLLIDIAHVPGLTENQISEVMGRIYWNSIEDDSGIPMDYHTHRKWICYYGSISEHSCSPNVLWKINIDRGKVIFRAAKKIECSDEILIWRSIILENIAYNTGWRRAYLMDTKDFECSCSRCKDPTEHGSFDSAMKCLESNCPGAMLAEDPISCLGSWKCDTCGRSESGEYFRNLWEDTIQAQHALNHSLVPFLEKVDNCKDWMKGINEGKKIISDAIQKLFHPKNSWVKLAKRDICAVLYAQIQGVTKSKESKYDKKLIVYYAKEVVGYCKEMLDDPSNFGLAGFTRWRGYMLTIYYASLCFLKINGTHAKIAEYKEEFDKLDQIANEAKSVLEFFANEPKQMEYMEDINRIETYFQFSKLR